MPARRRVRRARGERRRSELMVGEHKVIALLFSLAVLLHLPVLLAAGPHEVIEPDFWYYYGCMSKRCGGGLLESLCYLLGALSALAPRVAILKGFSLALHALTTLAVYALLRACSSVDSAVWGGAIYSLTYFSLLYGSGLSLRHDQLALLFALLAAWCAVKLVGGLGFRRRLMVLFLLLASLVAVFWSNPYTTVVWLSPILLFSVWEAWLWLRSKPSSRLLRVGAVAVLVAAIAVLAYLLYPYYKSASITVGAFKRYVVELQAPGLGEHLIYLNVLIPLSIAGLALSARRLKLPLIWLLVTLPVYLMYVRGLVYLYPMLAIFSGEALGRLKRRHALVLVSLIALVSLAWCIDSIPYFVARFGTTEEEYKACLWIRDNALGSRVLSVWDRGYLIMAVAEAKPVYWEVNKATLGDRVSDFFFSQTEEEALQKAEALGVDYILVHERMLTLYPDGSIQVLFHPRQSGVEYILNSLLFKLLYTPELLAYFKQVYSCPPAYVYQVPKL